MPSFTAERESLVSAIAKAEKGLSPRPLLPVHAGMLFSADGGILRVTASDGKFTFTGNCPVQGNGSFVLPGKMLSEISKYFTGDTVSIEVSARSAIITSGKSKFTLGASSDYPQWLETPQAYVQLHGEEFISAIRYVAAAASHVDPVLQAVRIEITGSHLEMICTDRSRMALASPEIIAVTLKADAESPGPVLVPAAALERVSHVCGDTVSLGWSGGLFGAYSDGVAMSAPQVAGEFIKGWKMIRDDYEPQVTADSAELTRLIKMAALAAGAKGTVTLALGERIVVSASGDASCSGELEISGTLEPRSMEFTPEYLLSAIKGENVQLATGRALFIESTQGRTLIQPRRRVAVSTVP